MVWRNAVILPLTECEEALVKRLWLARQSLPIFRFVKIRNRPHSKGCTVCICRFKRSSSLTLPDIVSLFTPAQILTFFRVENSIASIQHQKRFWLAASALTRQNFGGFFYPDSHSKTACRGFEPFCPCHRKIPETPAIARVSGIFLFAKKAQNAAKYAEKFQQKWYKSCTCVGKSWGIPPPEKWLQTQ